MALQFPLPMPNRGVRGVSFEPMRVDYAAPEVGGGGGGVTAGPARWQARWTIADGGRDVAVNWRTFVAALRGSQKLFIGRDMDRPWPVFYRGGLPSGWTGALGGWSQAIVGGQAILTVTGLYGGMGVGQGDYVDFRWTGTDGSERRSLVRAVQSVPSSGGAASFPVEPAVPAITPQNAAAHMDRAGCLMRLDTANTQLAETDMTRASPGASVISGLQVLLA